jgi:hypothetical protein
VRLAGEPREQALRRGEVALVRGAVVGAEHLGEGWVALREVGELVLEPLLVASAKPGSSSVMPRSRVTSSPTW